MSKVDRSEHRRTRFGGEGGIRTPDTVARMPHFECGAFNHSATSPNLNTPGLSAWRKSEIAPPLPFCYLVLNAFYRSPESISHLLRSSSCIAGSSCLTLGSCCV